MKKMLPPDITSQNSPFKKKARSFLLPSAMEAILLKRINFLRTKPRKLKSNCLKLIKECRLENRKIIILRGINKIIYYKKESNLKKLISYLEDFVKNKEKNKTVLPNALF